MKAFSMHKILFGSFRKIGKNTRKKYGSIFDAQGWVVQTWDQVLDLECNIRSFEASSIFWPGIQKASSAAGVKTDVNVW